MASSNDYPGFSGVPYPVAGPSGVTELDAQAAKGLAGSRASKAQRSRQPDADVSKSPEQVRAEIYRQAGR